MRQLVGVKWGQGKSSRTGANLWPKLKLGSNPNCDDPLGGHASLIHRAPDQRGVPAERVVVITLISEASPPSGSS